MPSLEQSAAMWDVVHEILERRAARVPAPLRPLYEPPDDPAYYAPFPEDEPLGETPEQWAEREQFEPREKFP